LVKRVCIMTRTQFHFLSLVLSLGCLVGSSFSALSCNQKVGGVNYNLDLGTFAGKEYSGANIIWQYRLNLCETFAAQGCTQDGTPMTAYQYNSDGTTGCTPIGNNPVYTPLTGSQKGLLIVMENAQCCTCKGNVNRKTTVTFQCDTVSNLNNVTVTEVQGGALCQYATVITHPNACGGGVGPNPPGKKTGGGGLGFGWIFVIVLLSSSVAYLIGGFIINWKLRGASPGVDALPQVELWKQVPGLVLDGFVFTKNKLMALTGRGYSQL